MANATISYSQWYVDQVLTSLVGMELAQKVNILPNIWRQDVDKTLTAKFRYVIPFVSGTYTDGAILPSSGWDPGSIDIAAVPYGVQTISTKLLDKIEPDTLSYIASQTATSLGRAMDSGIAALFTAVTGGTVGTTTTALTYDDVSTAAALLDAAYAPDDDRHGSLHPIQFGDLRKSVFGAGYGVVKLQVEADLQETMELNDISIMHNTDTPTANTGADWAGCFYHRQCFGATVSKEILVQNLELPGYASWVTEGTLAAGFGVVRPTIGVIAISGVAA